MVADVFAADIGAQRPVVGAEIAELRWVTRADAEQLEIAPLAREYFLPDGPYTSVVTRMTSVLAITRRCTSASATRAGSTR